MDQNRSRQDKKRQRLGIGTQKWDGARKWLTETERMGQVRLGSHAHLSPGSGLPLACCFPQGYESSQGIGAASSQGLGEGC